MSCSTWYTKAETENHLGKKTFDFMTFRAITRRSFFTLQIFMVGRTKTFLAASPATNPHNYFLASQTYSPTASSLRFVPIHYLQITIPPTSQLPLPLLLLSRLGLPADGTAAPLLMHRHQFASNRNGLQRLLISGSI